jgi:subtilisin-like proprotein convertase family protein
VPICGSGTTISDRGRYTDSVTIPSLGTVRVMRLDIDIADRRIMGIEIPFDDLVVTLSSPGGVDRQLWTNFYSDDTGGFFPNYGFPSRWDIPVWWLTSVGGAWDLEIDDTALTLSSTTLTSWCLTPLDPSIHSSTVIGSRLVHVATDTGSVPDCDTSVSPPDCPGVGIFETQVDDIIQATGTPELQLSISTSRWSDLRVVLTGADGSQSVVHNRSSTSPGSVIPLPLMAGEWMTGRYQLRVEDHVDGTTASVTSWSIMAN